MTMLEITPGPTGDVFEHLDAPPLVRWEPCAAFAGADPDGCATCGWLADDHPDGGQADEGQADEGQADDIAAGGVLVTLPARPRLRRAS